MTTQSSYRAGPFQSGSSLHATWPLGDTADTSGERGAKQSVLFLQSHPSWFARRLAGALEARSCRIVRVNFCLGDAAYWLGRPAFNFRGTLEKWPEYLRTLIAREQITDVLYYGDGRPYHRIAAEIAADVGINAYVYEFGYLRPDWITLERGGMSGKSHFPCDPEQIRAIGAQFPMPNLKAQTRYSMVEELTHEISYNLINYFFHLAYPRYVADRYYNPVVEYLIGIPKQMRVPRKRREAQQIVAKLIRDRCSFYLVPLQLQCDYQLRDHAQFAHQADAIRLAIESFAAHAPPTSNLVFKCHPLDNGGENWPKHINEAAAKAHVTDRVVYIEGGDLNALLSHAQGAVMINSTVGMHALIANRPVKILGTALFDIGGLTHQGPLETFWQSPERPDMFLVEAMVRALAGTIQVRGDFFTAEGQASAIAIFSERLINGSINGSGAFVVPPPRLASARHKTTSDRGKADLADKLRYSLSVSHRSSDDPLRQHYPPRRLPG